MAEDWLHIGTYCRIQGRSTDNYWIELRIGTTMVSLTPRQARETSALLLRAVDTCEAQRSGTLVAEPPVVEIPAEEAP